MSDVWTKREKVRLGLNLIYIPRFNELCLHLDKSWQPFQGRRSLEEQARLYSVGRTTPGKIVTNAGPGDSAHNYGAASDWTIFESDGTPVWDHGRWVELANACKAANLIWGGDFRTFPDKPHVELPIQGSWKELKLLLNNPDALHKEILKRERNIQGWTK